MINSIYLNLIDDAMLDDEEFEVLNKIVSDNGCYSIGCSSELCPINKIKNGVDCGRFLGSFGLDNTHKDTAKMAKFIIERTCGFWNL